MVEPNLPGTPVFRYQQIADTLRQRILQGDYPSYRLPSERQLMLEFAVQRDTVRRALEVLVAQGILLRDSTRGTRIAPALHSAAVPARNGGVLLIIRTFSDTTAPSAVFRGLARRLGEEGVATYWHDPGEKSAAWTGAGPAQLIPPLELLHRRGIQGVVLWPPFPIELPPLRALRASLPLILIDRQVPGLETDFVGFQDVAGGRLVTEHFLALGHRRIGFLSGEPQASAVHRRQAGYQEALRVAGCAADPSSLVFHQEGGSRRLAPEIVAKFLQADGDPLTAVVCANDLVAAHLIQFARGLGYRVPENLAVSGFGDLLPAIMDAFGITTVAQPFEELGCTAGDLLLRRLSVPSLAVPAASEEIVLPMRLIIRQSCGASLGPTTK